MPDRILLQYWQVSTAYTLLTLLAPALFLVCYLACLAAQARQDTGHAEANTLPLWMNLVYPSWLDRLTVGGIVRAFVQALAMTTALLVIVVAVLPVLAGKLLVR